MDTTKQWYQSKGVWGGLVSLGAVIASMFGLNLNADIQADLVNWFVAGSGVVGSLLAIIGRVKAQSRIGSRQ